jgi:ribulose-5-phosphate 4-epimerase/fuculose-1-phosphate aldolase
MSKMDVLEAELRTAAAILEWEMGDIWGHVGVRVPDEESIAVKLIRPSDEPGAPDWLVKYDYDLKKQSGVNTVPSEAAIYSEVFRARPDAVAAVHTHAPMCVTLSMVGKTVSALHMQSKKFGKGVPVFQDPIFIIDADEGAAMARTLKDACAVILRGHGIVTVGSSIDEACMTAVYLERTAKMLAVAYQMGFTEPTDEFVETLMKTTEKRLSWVKSTGRDTSDGRKSYEWRYYAEKVRKGERWMRGVG